MQSDLSFGSQDHARKAYLDINSTPNPTLLSSLASSEVSEIVVTDASGFMRVNSGESFGVSKSGPQTAAEQGSGSALSGAGVADEDSRGNRLLSLLSKVRRVSRLTLQLSQPQTVEEVMRTLPDALQGVSTSLRALHLELVGFDPSMGASLSALIASPDSRLRELFVRTTALPIQPAAVFGLAEALRSNTGLDTLSFDNVAPTTVQECFTVVADALDGNVMREKPLLCCLNGEERRLTTQSLRSM